MGFVGFMWDVFGVGLWGWGWVAHDFGEDFLASLGLLEDVGEGVLVELEFLTRGLGEGFEFGGGDVVFDGAAVEGVGDAAEGLQGGLEVGFGAVLGVQEGESVHGILF